MFLILTCLKAKLVGNQGEARDGGGVLAKGIAVSIPKRVVGVARRYEVIEVGRQLLA